MVEWAPPAEGFKAPRSASEATVYLTSPLHPVALDLAQRTFARVLGAGTDHEESLSRAESLLQADAALVRQGGLSAAELRPESTPRLQIVSRSGVGYDSIDPQSCRDRGIAVTNLPGANSQAVAELALTLMLSLLRRVKELDVRLTSGEVISSVHALAPGLAGKTVGLIGMGNTARQLAYMLRPFGCRILVFSPTSSRSKWTVDDPITTHGPGSGKAIEHERVELETILRQSDVISLHCPYTPETVDLIGEKELGMMKSSAILINTARGGIVDERALEKALGARKLAGAGLDVFEVEPARAENLGLLGGMNNVICLPHVGASTELVAETSTVAAMEILANFFDKGEIKHRVI